MHESIPINEKENNTGLLASCYSGDLIQTAMNYAISCHEKTNHLYDGKPYRIHLQMAYDFGCKYAYLLPKEGVDLALAACWVHDTIEDCRQTYNDVKKACGEAVAEIAYALTNEKGRNRQERANEKYYAGIKDTRFADFVKICDRLANVKYSKDSRSRMIEVYRKENTNFQLKLWSPRYQALFDELEQMLH